MFQDAARPGTDDSVFRNEVCWFMSNFQQVLYPVICMTHCDVSLNFLSLMHICKLMFSILEASDKGDLEARLDYSNQYPRSCENYNFLILSKKLTHQNWETSVVSLNFFERLLNFSQHYVIQDKLMGKFMVIWIIQKELLNQ